MTAKRAGWVQRRVVLWRGQWVHPHRKALVMTKPVKSAVVVVDRDKDLSRDSKKGGGQ